MKYLFLFCSFLLVGDAAIATSGSPPSNKTLQQVTAESQSKALAKKISAKAQSMSREFWEGSRKDVRGGVEDFILWLKQEVGEAFDMANDLPNFVIAAKIVFSAACSHDIVEYRKGWSVFLSITVKYAAAISCATIEPLVLPYVCLFAGHLVGKYAGDGIGKLIHESSCGKRVEFAKLAGQIDVVIDSVDPYATSEWQELKLAIGK